jgi:hypothetical protein
MFYRAPARHGVSDSSIDATAHDASMMTSGSPGTAGPTRPRPWHRRRPQRRIVLAVVALVGAGMPSCSMLRRQPKTVTEPAPVFTSATGAPTSFVASTSDAKTTRIIMVRDGLTKPMAFRLASEYLAQKSTIDVSDPNSGYLMTPWQATLSREGAPELRYRTRIILRFLGDEWKQLAVRAEANWLRGEEWEIGYDAAVLDSVTSDLTARLGRRP